MESQEADGSPFIDSFRYCLNAQLQKFILRMALPRFIPVFFPWGYQAKMNHFRSLVTDKLDVGGREAGGIVEHLGVKILNYPPIYII